jgi:hypothetical protein
MKELVRVYRFNVEHGCSAWREGRFILRQRRQDRHYNGGRVK